LRAGGLGGNVVWQVYRAVQPARISEVRVVIVLEQIPNIVLGADLLS
jgi:hypothetical protein